MTFMITLLFGIFSNHNLTISLLGSGSDTAISGVHLNLSSDEAVKEGLWSYCPDAVEPTMAPVEPVYSVELLQVNVDEGILSGAVFAVDMVFKNTGNTRLFSADSGCYGATMLNIGTQKAQDRDSVLGAADRVISGWLSPKRIQMTDPYVDPDGTFHVIFQSIAPEGDNIYREFFQPLVEGKAWLGEAFGVDIIVGTPTDQMKTDIGFVQDLSLAAADLTGLERNVEASVADQKMWARFGELRVWEMQMSSGAYNTPTPRGTYKVLTKQELRIGGKAPHYRMPYFQLWDSRGYGIHALPYLASDGGTFWSEALTDIGIPVSHGCIRTLPDDALQLYEFTSIGTPVWVR